MTILRLTALMITVLILDPLTQNARAATEPVRVSQVTGQR